MIVKPQRSTLIQALVLIAAFGLLYHHTITKLVKDWSIDPNFSHGFLVPFVALYMVWYKKDHLATLTPKSSLTGLVVIVFGMLCHIAGNIGAELFIMRLSIVITLSGIVLYLFGQSRPLSGTGLPSPCSCLLQTCHRT
jgi:hypothetical protein